MKKNLKLVFAVFAMLLVSVACFADVSPKDKKCEGAWVLENDSSQGFYFKDGNVYTIYKGTWFDKSQTEPSWKMYVYDDSFEWRWLNHEVHKITSIDGNKITIEVKIEELEPEKRIYKKASKIPPKSTKNYEDVFDWDAM